ncbi:hypothetical protein [Oceanobacillus alkalisoli]|nr:hypothetical protein [Oceanobacillus alkalisoli]
MLPQDGANLIEPPFYRNGDKGNSGDDSELKKTGTRGQSNCPT